MPCSLNTGPSSTRYRDGLRCTTFCSCWHRDKPLRHRQPKSIRILLGRDDRRLFTTTSKQARFLDIHLERLVQCELQNWENVGSCIRMESWQTSPYYRDPSTHLTNEINHSDDKLPTILVYSNEKTIVHHILICQEFCNELIYGSHYMWEGL